MGSNDRKSHKFGSLIAGKPIHHPLVSCPLILVGIGCLVDSPGDIRALAMDAYQNACILAVDPEQWISIADFPKSVADNLLYVSKASCGNFAGNMDGACRGKRFNCYPRIRVLGD